MAKKKADNTAEIGFEQQIWSAADKLRGNIDASEYKNVVLGLIFLKWIGYIFLDDLGRTKPAFLNSTGVMYPSVECILKLLYQCT